MNSFLTFVLLAIVLGMASVNLSLPLLSDVGQTAVQGAAAGFNSFVIICVSVAGVGFVLAFNSK